MYKSEINHLFKYRFFNEYTVQSLTDDVIWISSRENLNDPFDMRFEVEADLTYTAARLLNPQVTALNYIQKQKEFIEKLKNEFQTGGVFCLTETNDNILMWSHYADSHKGICIGYRRSEANLLGSDNCRQVVYGEFPRFGLAELFGALTTREQTIGEMIFEKMVLVKSIYWNYEKEWRILFREYDQLVKAPAPIESITFGAKLKEENRSKIREALKAHPEIKLYQAEILSEYRIGIQDIS